MVLLQRSGISLKQSYLFDSCQCHGSAPMALAWLKQTGCLSLSGLALTFLTLLFICHRVSCHLGSEQWSHKPLKALFLSYPGNKVCLKKIYVTGLACSLICSCLNYADFTYRSPWSWSQPSLMHPKFIDFCEAACLYLVCVIGHLHWLPIEFGISFKPSSVWPTKLLQWALVPTFNYSHLCTFQPSIFRFESLGWASIEQCHRCLHITCCCL